MFVPFQKRSGGHGRARIYDKRWMLINRPDFNKHLHKAEGTLTWNASTSIREAERTLMHRLFANIAAWAVMSIFILCMQFLCFHIIPSITFTTCMRSRAPTEAHLNKACPKRERNQFWLMTRVPSKPCTKNSTDTHLVCCQTPDHTPLAHPFLKCPLRFQLLSSEANTYFRTPLSGRNILGHQP